MQKYIQKLYLLGLESHICFFFLIKVVHVAKVVHVTNLKEDWEIYSSQAVLFQAYMAKSCLLAGSWQSGPTVSFTFESEGLLMRATLSLEI